MTTTTPILRLWGALAAGLGLAAGIFILNRQRFDWAFELIDIPAVWFALGLGFAGLLVLPLPWLIQRSALLELREKKHLLIFVVVIGLALRASMFLVEPVLEDDYYRYLWDGGVTAHGYNPFALAPAAAKEEGLETAIGRLAEQAGVVMDRINHPDLKTIYPAVAQAAFALAHLIEPWSVRAWRLVCLGGELATLGLLIALLGAAARSPLWAALYWWNPLIIKEMINSAHMEAILMPLVLGATLLCVRGRMLSAAGILGLAAGAKLWPILLAPLLLRPLLARPLMLLAAAMILLVMMIAWILPPYLGGIDETSGFVAFANYWQTNSALFPVLSKAVDWICGTFRLPVENAGLIVRGALGIIVASIGLALAIRPWTDARDLLGKTLVFTAALFLLSPAQFPWYAAWMMPFLAFHLSRPLLALTALLPLYYVSFHFLARDNYDTYRYGLVWFIWLPVWAGIAWQFWRLRSTTAHRVPNA